MVLTRWSAALAAALTLLVAVIGTWWAALGALVVLAAVLIVDTLLAPNPSRLRVERGGDEVIKLGESAHVWVTVANPTQRPVRLRLRDSWIPSAGATGGLAWLTVPPRQRRRHETELTPTRRGDREAGPVVIRTTGPLHLAGRQRELDVPKSVRVLPPFRSRKHLPSRVRRLRELDGRSVLLQRGDGTEFDSLREYVPGDDVRSVDWRTTARTHTVVVKTWRPERDRHVLIVLDSGRTSAGRVGDEPKLDHAMDAALLLAALASRAGDRVDLIIVDRVLRTAVQKKSSSELLESLVHAMAPVEASLAETHHRTMINEILKRVSQRSFVVLLTGLDGASIDDGLVPVLGPLLHKHRVTVASVADPRIDELRAGHETIEEVYAAAAAERGAERTQGVADRLRRMGVTVVEAPPERIAPDLADHYLDLKRAGRL